MKNKNLIGISGLARSGKNVTASLINEILIENKKEQYKEKAFAYLVKKFCSELTGIPIEGWETEEDKNTELGPEWAVYNELGMKVKITRRKFMQRLGTGAITSHLHPNAFINQMFLNYDPSNLLLITDIRFMNELTAVQKDRNGFIIRIQKPGNKQLNDVSETELDKYTGWDYLIINDGTKEELKAKVKLILFKIGLL